MVGRQVDGFGVVAHKVVELPLGPIPRHGLPGAAAHGLVPFVLPVQRVMASPRPAFEQRPQTHAFHRRDRTTASVGGIRGPGHVDDRGHEIDDVPGLSHEPPPRRDAFWPVCDERRSDSALVHPVLVETERRIAGSQPVRWALNLLHRTAQVGVTSYILQLGDVIKVKHFHNPELNELVPIRPDGRISLELVGEVQAAGLPVGDLQAILLQRYTAFVRKAEVAVIVKEFGGNRVYIAGEVTRPGVIQTNGHLTILQAIFEAGGFLRSAELRTVVVLRNQGTASPGFLTFDLKDSLKKPGEHLNDALLRPYDIVYVPKTRVTRMGDFVDQYINQLIPLPVTLGLSYLFR